MRKYAVTGAFCIADAVLYCALRDFPPMPMPEKYRTLCDAFTIPGVLCLCVGVLIWISRDGFFHGLGYCLSVTRKAFLPGRKNMESYYNYVSRRRQKPHTPCGFLLVTGAVCMTLAIIFLVLFYRL